MIADASGASWYVEFFDSVTGKSTGESRIAVSNRKVQIVLLEFQGSIAVRLDRTEPSQRSQTCGHPEIAQSASPRTHSVTGARQLVTR